jgi:predicted transport protein
MPTRQVDFTHNLEQTDKPVSDKAMIVTYTIQDHLQGKPETTVELFELLRERILELGNEVIEKALKLYVGYKHGRNFCEIKIQQRALKMYLNIPFEDLNDPSGMAKNVAHKGHHGTGDVEVRLESIDQIDTVIKLIEQAYQQTL